MYIAQYEEYTRPLIDHLVEEKLKHWDMSVREFAAEALHNLTPRDPTYIREQGVCYTYIHTSEYDIYSLFIFF